jgi:hypothetical protein
MGNDLTRRAGRDPLYDDLHTRRVVAAGWIYRQPVGQKLLAMSRGLRQQTEQIGQDISRKASDELRQRLTDALRQKGHKL